MSSGDDVVLRIEVDDRTEGMTRQERFDRMRGMVGMPPRDAETGRFVSRTPRVSGGGAGMLAARGASAVGGLGASVIGAGLGAGAGAALVGVGALAVAAAATAEALRRVTNEANRLAYVTPQIAIAQQVGEVNRITGDISRGQRFGDTFAEFITARDELAEELRELRTTTLAAITPLLTSMLSAMGDLLKSLNEAVDVSVWTEVGSAIVDYLLAEFNGAPRINNTLQLLGRIADALEDDEQDPDVLKSINRLLDPNQPVQVGPRAMIQRPRGRNAG